MCYSAGASLVTSAGLAVVGVESIRIANKKQKLLAAIPLFFAIQQAFEGYQWISLGYGQPSMFAAYGFLFFAFLWWPSYVPITLLVLDSKKKKILELILGLGLFVSLVLFGSLISAPLSISILGYSINYSIFIPLGSLITILYITATCGSFILSTDRFIRWFGIVLLCLSILSLIFFYYVFVSVWCFSAAILSSLIYVYIKFFK